MKLFLLFFLSITILFGCAAPEKKMEKKETLYYPMPPQKPKLQFLTSITNETDLGKEEGGFKEFLLGETPSEKEIKRPYDIVAARGKIYICDTTINKIIIINLKEKTFDLLKDERGGALVEPEGMWITEDGYKYIADKKRKQVIVYDKDDKFVKSYGKKDELARPLDVAVYENKVYVADFDKHQIVVFDKDSGEVIQRIGEGGGGKEEGKFNRPSHVILDKEGTLYIDDSFNFRIQKFSPSGELLKVFGYHGDTIGGFARPKGIAIDDENHLYVVDTAFENVQIFDANSATLLLFFGGFGVGPGSMYLPSPVGIDYVNIDYFSQYVDKDFKVKYLVYVGNTAGVKKINVYGFGEWIGPPLPEM